jgi:hypothetical protein
MKKTLTYLVFLLTLCVSVSASAAFPSPSGGTTFNRGCFSGDSPSVCKQSGGRWETPFCYFGPNPVRGASCILPAPTNATCSGTGSSRTCSCNTGFSEVTSAKQCVSSCASVGGFSENVNGVQTCVSACAAGNIPVETSSGPVCSASQDYENDCTGDGKYLNKNADGVYSCSTAETNFGTTLAAILGTIAAAAIAALACTASAMVACGAAIAFNLAGAGVLIYDNWGTFTPDSTTSTAAQSASPNGNAFTVQLGQADNTKTGVHRDTNGNLTPTGTGWTKNGDTYTRTETDGTKTSTSTVNTANDTFTHTVTNTSTGKVSTTSGSGGGSDSGGGGASIATSSTLNNQTTASELKTNSQGVTEQVTLTCTGSNCTNPNNPTNGDGTGNSNGTGDGDGNSECPECEILTNILNTLKGQGTDGAAALQGAQTGLENGLNTAINQLDQGFNDLLNGLPIQEALDELGLNPISHFNDNPSCSLPVSILGVNSQISYCEWQEQIHAGVAFFAFIMFLFSVREIVFERPQ